MLDKHTNTETAVFHYFYISLWFTFHSKYAEDLLENLNLYISAFVDVLNINWEPTAVKITLSFKFLSQSEHKKSVEIRQLWWVFLIKMIYELQFQQFIGKTSNRI